jgi:hypothetical protein
MLRDIFSLADERLKKNYYYVKNIEKPQLEKLDNYCSSTNR